MNLRKDKVMEQNVVLKGLFFYINPQWHIAYNCLSFDIYNL